MTDLPPQGPCVPPEDQFRQISGEDAFRARLEREAEFFPRQFRRHPAGPRLAQAYVQAHLELPDLCSASEAESRTVRIVVDRELDALAIEPWLRRSPSRHLLSRKLMLVAYVMECDGCHPEIRKELTSRRIGIASLFVTSITSALRMTRGRLQMLIHGLV